MTDEGESTKIVVGRMLKKRQRMRVPIIIGSLLALAFLGYMGLEFGAPRSADVKVDGPVYGGHPVGKEAPPQGETAKKTDPPIATGMAAVEVIVPARNAQLWVDGKQMDAAPTHNLQLTAGKHLLMLQQAKRTVAQKLYLNGGDVYRVEFGDKVAVTKEK